MLLMEKPRFDPTLLKISPKTKAVLNRSEKELKWIIPEIPLDGSPGKLRVRIPIDTSPEDGNGEINIAGYVKFSCQGSRLLSGAVLVLRQVWAEKGTGGIHMAFP
ncbi:hypothetical protein SAY87_011240 [Trapa incisa]|uniref:Uncharacterized protein n=1 Tax=Trapa incisa TaxID=236973 RepID=A0AAN7GI89_9MYRT|nr:hypothetical protein SAY87_011240 [Trapa incisa]